MYQPVSLFIFLGQGRPLTWMSPEILPVFTLLARMSKKVVLPHPEGPMMANIRPLEDFSVLLNLYRRGDIEESGWW
jgi:hypothetical protein